MCAEPHFFTLARVRIYDVRGTSTSEPAVTLNWGTSYQLTLLDLGLACCGVEMMTALHAAADQPATPPTADAPEKVSVLVVSGTVTDVMLPAIMATYRNLPEPRYVLSVGACSNTGGPYWDSYSVTKGIDQMLPVHIAVPGCPPRPEALLDGLTALHKLVQS